MGNKALLLACLVGLAPALWADEVFDSRIFGKEVVQSYGSGALSVATEAYFILVYNKDNYMRIEVPRKAFDQLLEGDVVRVTFVRGLFSNEIKKIALVKGVKQ